MTKKIASSKDITLSLFSIEEAKGNIAEAIRDALKKKDKVENRYFELEEDRGTACAVDAKSENGFVLLHIVRFEKGASIDIIRHATDDLKKTSLDVDVKSPEADTDYLKTQAIVLFEGQGAIATVSDGRDYSLIWSFIHKLLGKQSFIPRQVFSKAIKEAIEKRGVKYVRMNGYVQPKSVKEAIGSLDMSQLNFCSSSDDAGKKRSSVKVQLKFTPEKNVKEFFASFMPSIFEGGSKAINSDDDLFSIVVQTEQGEKIERDGFCRSKKTRLTRRGSFVFRNDAYQELIGWFKELQGHHEWPY